MAKKHEKNPCYIEHLLLFFFNLVFQSISQLESQFSGIQIHSLLAFKYISSNWLKPC